MADESNVCTILQYADTFFLNTLRIVCIGVVLRNYRTLCASGALDTVVLSKELLEEIERRRLSRAQIYFHDCQDHNEADAS